MFSPENRKVYNQFDDRYARPVLIFLPSLQFGRCFHLVHCANSQNVYSILAITEQLAKHSTEPDHENVLIKINSRSINLIACDPQAIGMLG